MRYRVSHSTRYDYEGPVTDSYGIAYVTPRELPWQQVRSHEIVFDPAAVDTRRDTDVYGNTATYFQVLEEHDRLQVRGLSEVEVSDPVYDEAALAQPWEACRPRSGGGAVPGAWRQRDFVLPSTLVSPTDEARAYAARSLVPGRPIGEAVTDLVSRIHDEFAYVSGSTTVRTTIDQLFEHRRGVCQDFAHLAIACLRSHGLAARYVSGYLRTFPPPGRPRLVGADASHAWLAVWVPGLDAGGRADLDPDAGGFWFAVDPTNDKRADAGFVTLAWGRDYRDVPPLRGVIFTEESGSTMTVEVDVAPQADEIRDDESRTDESQDGEIREGP